MLVVNLSKKKFIYEYGELLPNKRAEMRPEQALKLKRMYPKDIDVIEIEDAKEEVKVPTPRKSNKKGKKQVK